MFRFIVCGSLWSVVAGFRVLRMSTTTTTTTTTTTANNTRPRIAVIGSGAAGLAAAQVLSRSSNMPCDTIVWEQDDSIGGVWRHVAYSTTRPMYQGLRTNLPKEIMAFRAYPWKGPEASFLTHTEVFQYLKDYAREFHLEQYIRLQTRVDNLTVLETGEPSRLNKEWNQIRLDLTTKTTGASFSQIFDGVIVCNGHYSLPVIPQLPGLEHYRGAMMHSIEYDTPTVFGIQTVLCVGGRASGSDVAREIAPYATHVYLSDTTLMTQSGQPVTKFNVTWVPRTVGIADTGNIRFDHNCTVTPTVDVILFCTGYEYHFPFLENSNLPIQVGGRRVSPLYEQLWHATCPNVAFVGLPHSIVPFPLFEFQLEAIEKQWMDWTLPKGPELLDAAERDASGGGYGKVNGRVPEDTHYLGDAQWDYCRRMAQYAGIYDDHTEAYIATNKAIWDHSGRERKNEFPGGPDYYRETIYDRSQLGQAFQVLRSGVDEMADSTVAQAQ